MKMFLVFLSLLSVSQHASGVEVYEGAESVLLPCRVSVSVSEGSTVVWSREELKDSIIHARLPSGDDELTRQNQIYRSRTSMKTEALKTGDLSLTLTKPNIFDSGNYTCTVRRKGVDLSRMNVELQVKEPPPVWPKVLLVLLLVVAAVGGFIMCRKYKELKDKISLIEQRVRTVRVRHGERSVQLLFMIKTDLTGNIKVEVKRSDRHRMVCVYENNEGQSCGRYEGRIKMENPLKAGDLSLIMTDPRPDDSGVYVCTVYENGNLLTEQIVVLLVTQGWHGKAFSDVGQSACPQTPEGQRCSSSSERINMLSN